MFKIIGVYKGKKEVIESEVADDWVKNILKEYRMAFSSEWILYSKKIK